MDEDWEVTYPEGLIKYNRLFREKFMEYDRHVEYLDNLYKRHGVENILDLGCGTGDYLIRFAEKGYSCVGIDISEESLDIAKERAEKRSLDIRYINRDMTSIDLDESFDAVIAMHIPVSLSSLNRALQNTAELINERGLLSYMYVERRPGIPERDDETLLSVVENEDTTIARIEPWKLRDNIVSWKPLLLIQDGKEFKFKTDKDKMELLSKRKVDKLHNTIKKYGMELIDTNYLHNSKSAPPWSIEVIETVGK